MGILVDRDTRLLVQGITGREGSYHALRCSEYGTNLVAGVTPGRGGMTYDDRVPVFDMVADAVRQTAANTSLIFVPPAFAADAIIEAVDAGIETIVCITEGIPVLDTVQVVRYLKDKSATLIGPNGPGIISPGAGCKVGIMPASIHLPGRVGVVSRSGTLTYEAVDQTMSIDEGQSTCIGIGGDPVNGTGFIDCLSAFEADPQTEAVVMIGEIGGSAEEEAAAWVAANMSKPVVGFVAGMTAPPGKRMGHAGAIISGGKGTAAEKVAAMEAAGIHCAKDPSEIGAVLLDALKAAGLR